MKDLILLELARKWEIDASDPKTANGASEAAIRNATDKGIREGKRECADTLRSLIVLLGSKPEKE
jgi:hypothetical protein